MKLQNDEYRLCHLVKEKHVELAIIAELEPFQFAFKARRHFDDTMLTLFNFEAFGRHQKTCEIASY